MSVGADGGGSGRREVVNATPVSPQVDLLHPGGVGDVDPGSVEGTGRQGPEEPGELGNRPVEEGLERLVQESGVTRVPTHRSKVLVSGEKKEEGTPEGPRKGPSQSYPTPPPFDRGFGPGHLTKVVV